MSDMERNRCQARTKSGTRCKRAAMESHSFCKQHAEDVKQALWKHPHGAMDYIPEPPEVLTEKASGHWHQFCMALKEYGKLWGIYLGDLFEICWRIDWRDDLEAAMNQHGFINYYENGPQLIGIDKVIDRNDKRITDLKKQFGLTMDTAHKLTASKKPAQRPDKKKTENQQKREKGGGLRKVKGF